ncbi:MAG: cyclase family protein [Chloroflexi bacterium]|nr:cyclase family protein [Chloroflexota bacterium]
MQTRDEQPTYIDITLPLTPGMPNWPGNPPFKRELFKALARGDSSNVSAVGLSCHAGTHVDAPYHSSDQGVGMEGLPLSVLIGPASVREVPAAEKVARTDLEALKLSGVQRLLLKTRNSALLRKREFAPDFVYVDESAAQYLVEKGVKLLGVDYFSVDRPGDKQKPAHHLLLRQGTIIIEAVDLSGVGPGEYELICLPLNIPGSDGAPARVVLRTLPPDR